MNESDVKVNETNSSQANLLIQDRIAFDDDNNLNDQIISPSDGIQVPNASQFYQMQREIRSNQVQKKNEIAIRVVEQEVESEKLDSPKPLDSASDFLNNDDQQNDFKVEEVIDHDRDQDDKENQSDVGSGLLLNNQKGISTLNQLEIDLTNINGDSRKDTLREQHSKLLFRTQKMSGLA